MAVRERDDTGWDELPGGLPFSDDDEPLDPPRGRGLRTAAWLLVVGLLLGGGGAFGARWLGESDVRSVLASSTATYAQVLTRLRSAADAEALAAAAAGAPGAAERLQADLDRLDSTSGERRRAVAGQVAAERDVLLAVAALDEVDRAPLRIWGMAHAELAAAVEAEERARSVLLVADSAAAQRLPDTPAVIRRIGSTVGEAVVGDVARSAGDLLADLGAATRTADLRTAAERAEGQRSAVVAAQEGLGGSADAAVLAAFANALQAVGELRTLTPAETGGWPAVRTRMGDALRIVADADSSVAAGLVRGRLPIVLESIDRLVVQAEQAQAAWQPAYDAALAAQAGDDAALRAHGDRVRAAVEAWTQLRSDVEALAGTGGAGEVLVAAASDATSLRTDLAAAAPPAGVEAAHAGLVAAVDAVARPLAAGVVALDCIECTGVQDTLRDSVGAAALALPAWDPALAAWEAALAAAQQAVTDRALPPPPDA